ALQRLRRLLFGELLQLDAAFQAGADGVQGALQLLAVDILQHGLEAALCRDLRNAAPHEAGAENADFLDAHARLLSSAARARPWYTMASAGRPLRLRGAAPGKL